MLAIEELESVRDRRRTAFLGRLVVAIVLSLIVLVVTFAAFASARWQGSARPTDLVDVPIGPWSVLVSRELPPMAVVATAVAGMLVVAVCAVGLEVIAALLSISPRRKRLAWLRSTDPDPITDHPRVHVTVLVPAHNEENALPVTLGALARQDRPPDRVIVVADNCTDRTAEIARDLGHETFETVDNVHKKGGALNQALRLLLPTMDPRDAVLVMDADTSLVPEFLDVAAGHLEDDPELAAVGGVFYGEPGHGLIGQFQRNEYARYSNQIRARRGRVFVLTGTATLFRAGAMKDVAAARGVFIPGNPGSVYDTSALTEDNELTLALKSLGGTMMSPGECKVVTELMPAWRNLWRQRKRWQRGALENLGAYGMTRATLRYWGQQIGIGYGVVALNSALLLLLTTFLAIDNWIWFPFWTAVGLVFAIERTLTAWGTGWRGRLLAITVLPELLYDVFLQVVFVSALIDISRSSEARWGHVDHGSGVAEAAA